MKQQIQLGEAIRQRYIESGFLSQGFDPEMVSFQVFLWDNVNQQHYQSVMAWFLNGPNQRA